MKLEELADLMGKSIEEVKDILNQSDVIELKLTESSKSKTSRKDAIGISEL